MYDRIRRVAVRPGRPAEAIRTWQEQIISHLQQQKGFQHLYITPNQAANQKEGKNSLCLCLI